MINISIRMSFKLCKDNHKWNKCREFGRRNKNTNRGKRLDLYMQTNETYLR